jgi:hypothetical protein
MVVAGAGCKENENERRRSRFYHPVKANQDDMT